MWRRITISLAAIAGTMLGLELLLRTLPVSTATLTGYYFDKDVLTYPAHHEWWVSTGWSLRNPQHLRSNNYGFVSALDFQSDPRALALIGDSYVEASMLDAADRPEAQLQTLLADSRRVYGLGAPGTALLDYAQRIRFANQSLQITDFVVWLERGDARQSLCGSGNVHSRCLDPHALAPRVQRRPEPTWVKRIARHSVLAQYLFGQLKVDLPAIAAATFRRNVPGEPDTPEARAASTVSRGNPPRISDRTVKVVDTVLDRFFEEIGPYARGRLIFLVDGYRKAAPRKVSELDLERDYLIQQLRARGAEVVDLQPAFEARSSRDGLSLEVGPYDRHLNRLGVRLAMEQAAAQLRR
jgi:hypothetical protein